MKKLHYAIIILIILVIISGFYIAFPPLTPTNNISDSSNGNIIIINDGDIIQDCSQRGIEGKVLVIHRRGCSACAIAVPRLQELESELNMNFDFYDLVIDQDKENLLEIGTVPLYVPTVIIDCEVHVGVLTKEEYKSLIEGV